MTDRNDLAFWFERLKATGVNVPRTTIVRATGSVAEAAYGEYSPHVAPLIEDLKRAAADIGYPVFLRTGHGSGKHGWKDTCFVERPEDFGTHVPNLIEWSECVSMPFGLPTDVWVVREFLPLVSMFKAFHGRMPINREFRAFIEGGEVRCLHAYWPAFALKGQSPSKSNWSELLTEMNKLLVGDDALIRTQSALVSCAFDGAWSLDWAQTQDGTWYAIDMAVAEESFHWPGCPKSDQKEPPSEEEREAMAGALLVAKGPT